MVRNYDMEEPLFVIVITFLALAWFTCLLRAWVKLVVLRKVTTDDYLMLCGIVSTLFRVSDSIQSFLASTDTSSRSSTPGTRGRHSTA